MGDFLSFDGSDLGKLPVSCLLWMDFIPGSPLVKAIIKLDVAYPVYLRKEKTDPKGRALVDELKPLFGIKKTGTHTFTMGVSYKKRSKTLAYVTSAYTMYKADYVISNGVVFSNIDTIRESPNPDLDMEINKIILFGLIFTKVGCKPHITRGVKSNVDGVYSVSPAGIGEYKVRPDKYALVRKEMLKNVDLTSLMYDMEHTAARIDKSYTCSMRITYWHIYELYDALSTLA